MHTVIVWYKKLPNAGHSADFILNGTWVKGGRAGVCVALLLLLGLFQAATLHAQILGFKMTPAAKPAPPPSAPAPAPTAVVASNQAIPLAQVSDQAEDLDRKLEEIAKNLLARQDTISPDRVIASQTAEVNERALQVDKFISDSPDVLQLRDEMVYWRALNQQAAEERRLLTQRAAELQSQIGLLDAEQSRWQATRDQIHDTDGIEVVAARVQQELDSIRKVRTQAQEQLNQVLTFQNQLSRAGRQTADSLTKLSEAEARFRSRLLDRDSQPLWAPRALRESDRPFTAMLRKTADQGFMTTGEFIRAGLPGLLSIPLVFILTLLAAFSLKRHVNTEGKPGVSPEAQETLGNPLAMALLVALIVSIPQTAAAPLAISVVIYALWLSLIFRLTPLLVLSELRPLTYLLLALNFIEVVRVGTMLSPLLNRGVLTLTLLAALIAFAWLARPLKLRQLPLSKWPMLLIQSGIRIALVMLAMALVANVSGFVALSHVLGVGTLLSAFVAVTLYCVVRVTLLALVVSLHSEWAAFVPAELRGSIERWARLGLILLAVYLWWTRSELYVFMIHDSFMGTITSVLTYPIGLGTIHFSLGTILSVVLILTLGYGLAKGSSSLLRSVLLAKFPLQRGLPYAISKVTYYGLMVLVLTAAVASAGVELNKFTVITGALGVGVGFGLQNIVSNFASGLILLFERPIRVDDTVEVNGLVGTVRRIGARSSTITTGQGAEVIVPNSNLLSNHVINWTLSSPWRRVEINVGVGYGSDPEAVLALLIEVASSYPDVMPEPAPLAYFLGFGDSALNFELRFWSARQDTWFQLKSDVTIGVARALREAGIEIPFPQRDFHMRSIDSSIQEVFSSGRADYSATGASGEAKLAPLKSSPAADNR